jgi:hypothetical protein
MKTISFGDNEAQRAFVNSKSRYAAYIGGLGSGKTFAGLVRGLLFSQQPTPEGRKHGPRGAVLAINYRVLEDVVLPAWAEIVAGTDYVVDDPDEDGLTYRSKKKAILKNGAEILFRSLDRPNWMRGLELSWFFIDEARHVGMEAWKILIGRLRQKDFQHGAWLASTPNGYDWQWALFHEDSPEKWPSTKWFGASTMANQRHLPEEYITDLLASYEGPYLRQEVYGEFLGVISGAVFPHWSTAAHAKREVPYDPDLPLYSFWDFGVGDLGVVLFAQIREVEKEVAGEKVYVKELRFVGEIAEDNKDADWWATAWKDYLRVHFGGRRPKSSWGDPAGKQRNMVTGTSVIDALTAAGVPVSPAPKKPVDFGATILDNMMAGGRVLADVTKCQELAKAFATHKWNVDPDTGLRIGSRPIHDRTSHFADAARYGAAALLSAFPRRTTPTPSEPPGPGTFGDLVNQLDEIDNPDGWLGHDLPRQPVLRFKVPTPDEPDIPAPLGH